MDEVKTVTLYDAETDSEVDFELVGVQVIDGLAYYMLAELEEGEADAEEDKAQDWLNGLEDEDDGDDVPAYLFHVCSKEEAEFTMTYEGKDLFVTTMMTDDEYNHAVDVFSSSDDYDIQIEEEV